MKGIVSRFLLPLCVLLSFKAHGNETPKDLFLKGFAHDKQCAKIYELMLIILDLEDAIWQDELPPEADCFGTLCRSVASYQTRLNDEWTTKMLTDMLGSIQRELGVSVGSPHALTNALRQYKKDIRADHFIPEQAMAHRAYNLAIETGEEKGVEPFFPAYIFAVGSRPLNKDNPAENVFCLTAAWMAEFALHEVPNDPDVAFMYYYRSSKDCKASRFEVALRLMCRDDLQPVQNKARREFAHLLPEQGRLPALVPSLEDYLSRDAIFRLISGTCFATLSFSILQNMTHGAYPEVSIFISLATSLVITYALESSLTSLKPYKGDEEGINNYCETIQKKTSVLDMNLLPLINKEQYELTPTFCRLLTQLDSIQKCKKLIWTKVYIHQLQLLAPERLFTEDAIVPPEEQ